MASKTNSRFNPVSWMAKNSVAANLLMLMMIIGGIVSLMDIRQEIFPNFIHEEVSVRMSYPGASPEEVEEGIILAIEAKLQSVEGIDKVSSSATEGSARVTATLEAGVNPDRVLQNIRTEVDSITSFPTDAEPARVQLASHPRFIGTIAVSGDLAEKAMFELANRVKEDLIVMDGVAQVSIWGAREPEIGIEISQTVLRSLGMTLPEVAQRVRSAARDIPSGDVETSDGQYMLRTEGRREQGMEFANIPLKTAEDGSQVTLGDLASITDGFEETSTYIGYKGARGMQVHVYQTESAKPLDLAQRLKAYAADLRAQLPENINVEITNDRSKRYSARMGMLIDNGAIGLLLVVLTLGLFLNPRLAFWVAVSIPVVFIGSFTILSFVGVSINMISMFAFIMTLGIVVDDAIIVGENIHAKRQQGLSVRDAVVEGANEMVLPVSFAVATNIIAFIPLLTLPGDMGQFMRSLPIVAVVVFAVSLIEALFVLPAHLNAKEKPLVWPAFLAPLQRGLLFRERLADGLDRFRDVKFKNALLWVIEKRYVAVVIFTGGLMLISAWFASDRIDFRWRPQIPSDRVDAEITMPADASVQDTIAMSKRVEVAGIQAINELGSLDDVESYSIRAGRWDPALAEVTFQLVNEEERDFNQDEFIRLWRDKLGEVTEVRSLVFEYLAGPGSYGVYVGMGHNSNAVVEAAAQELASIIKTYDGMVDVTDGLAQGKKQLRYTLTDEAKSLGFTENELGRQLRAAFFGAEALRMLRDSNQVKVWVRLPMDERNSLKDLDDFVVRSPSGVELPLAQAADIEYSRTFKDIDREDGRRNIYVGGEMDPAVGSESQIKRELTDSILPALRAKYPGLDAEVRSNFSRRSGNTPMSVIGTGLAVVSAVVFALMASLFRSYVQGFIVIMTIPYCVAAAVFGHIVLGYSLTANSMFGIIALAGMVVNGSLVLTTRMNDLISKGVDYREALVLGTLSRFRPIVLTAITTTVGLMPMLFETSVQALFLVPLAIALSFGTVVSIFVVLMLIPAFHAIHQDVLLKQRKTAGATLAE